MEKYPTQSSEFPSQPDSDYQVIEPSDLVVKNPNLPSKPFLLDNFETEVVSVSPTDCYEDRRGTIQESLVEMSDGTLYPFVKGTPHKNNLKSDTAVVFTTAWLTSTKGHNRRTFLRMLKLGYPAIMIGPESEETNYCVPVLKRFKQAATCSISKVSHDMNRGLDAIMPEVDVRQDDLIVIGESRGASEAPGFNNEQYSPERSAVYCDITAPAFARRPHILEMPGAAMQLGKEIPELGRLALKLPLEARGRHYAGTIHKNAEYYAKTPFAIPQLMSGEAGKLAIAARPNTPMHVLIFTGDGWSQPDEWRAIYKDKDRDGTEPVYIEMARGLHLSIARKSTLDNIALRLDALAEARGIDGDFDKVDFKTITALHTITRSQKQKSNVSKLVSKLFG